MVGGVGSSASSICGAGLGARERQYAASGGEVECPIPHDDPRGGEAAQQANGVCSGQPAQAPCLKVETMSPGIWHRKLRRSGENISGGSDRQFDEPGK